MRTARSGQLFSGKGVEWVRMNVNKYLFSVLLEWRKSIIAIRRITKRKKFDLIIADEAYELIIAFLFFPGIKKKAPFVMIYDFFGFDATTKSLLEKIGAYFWNFAWITGNRTPWVEDMSLFVGDAEDIADKSYGLFLPNARKHAEKHYKFLGNILPFNPQDYSNTAEMKSLLGYGAGPLDRMCRRRYGHWGGPFKSMFSHLQNY